MADYELDLASLPQVTAIPRISDLSDTYRRQNEELNRVAEEMGARVRAEKDAARRLATDNLEELRLISEALTAIKDQGKTESQKTRWLLRIAAAALTVAVAALVVTVIALV